jgi:hypothetical protein
MEPVKKIETCSTEIQTMSYTHSPLDNYNKIIGEVINKEAA